MAERYRPEGIVSDALLAVFQFKHGLIDEDLLVEILGQVEWEAFPSLLRVVLSDETKERIANGFRRAFGTAVAQ